VRSSLHWRQINIRLSGDRAEAEHQAFTTIAPALIAAENEGLVSNWFFIRKNPWRIRYMPVTDAAAEQAEQHLHDATVALCRGGYVTQPVQAVYEPETRAFGGTAAMTVAHDLFHADSKNIFVHLDPNNSTNGTSYGRRETSLLLCGALMRGARQDPFECGDIWDKVSALRTPQPTPGKATWDAFTASVVRLVTIDTRPTTKLRAQALRRIDPWLTAFESTGDALWCLADSGHLTRGLRSVIAHHVIFHWNRMGIDVTSQANLAHAAASGIFSD